MEIYILTEERSLLFQRNYEATAFKAYMEAETEAEKHQTAFKDMVCKVYPKASFKESTWVEHNANVMFLEKADDADTYLMLKIVKQGL